MTFALFVLHYLKGRAVGKAIKDNQGNNFFDGLAAEFTPLTPRTIWNRMQEFADRLPTDGRGGKRLTFWAIHLREAYSKEP